MKTLKESLLADIDDTLAAGDDAIKDTIFKFLCENYYIVSLKELDFKLDKTGKYLVSVNHPTVIRPSSEIKKLTNGTFKFDSIDGYFSVDSSEIETLEDAPQKIKGWFSCQYCDNLKTLEGMPATATELDCKYCENLVSLKGCPKQLHGFNCTGCNSLKDLSNGPKIVINDYVCSHCENLESLKGCATTVGNNFECSYCNSLKSIKYCPKKVGGNFTCWQDVEENGGMRFEEADIKAICKVGFKIKGAKNW